LLPGELLWMEIQRCRAQRFQVFAFTNALFIFPLEAYEHWLDSFWDPWSAPTRRGRRTNSP